MSIIKKMSDRIHYYLDSTGMGALKVKIDHFSFNAAQNHIVVVYRIGRQKLLNKMNLSKFGREYFEKISHYDQRRLTRFFTLQHMLEDLFTENVCRKEDFSRFIEEQIKNEQLF